LKGGEARQIVRERGNKGNLGNPGGKSRSLGGGKSMGTKEQIKQTPLAEKRGLRGRNCRARGLTLGAKSGSLGAKKTGRAPKGRPQEG